MRCPSTKGTDSSTGISAQIDDETLAVSEPGNRTVNLMREVDTHNTWKHADLQIADAGFDLFGKCASRLRIRTVACLAFGMWSSTFSSLVAPFR